MLGYLGFMSINATYSILATLATTKKHVASQLHLTPWLSVVLYLTVVQRPCAMPQPPGTT